MRTGGDSLAQCCGTSLVVTKEACYWQAGQQCLLMCVHQSLLEHHLLCTGEVVVFAVAISWCS